jgi:hypothetical protein
MAHATEGHVTKEMQRCIDNCLDCSSFCIQTVQHCLELGGRHAEASHIRTLNDCAAICQTSAGFMLRGSPMHTKTCALCAEVCRECASACRRMGDDPIMEECAQICDRCAESCERIAQAG